MFIVMSTLLCFGRSLTFDWPEFVPFYLEVTNLQQVNSDIGRASLDQSLLLSFNLVI